MSRPSYVPAVVPAGGTTPTNWTKMVGQQLVGFIIPANLVSTAITFHMSPDLNASTITDIAVADSSGSAVSFTVSTTALYIGFTQDQTAKFDGIENVKPVCGSTETNGATITLVTVPRNS